MSDVRTEREMRKRVRELVATADDALARGDGQIARSWLLYAADHAAEIDESMARAIRVRAREVAP